MGNSGLMKLFFPGDNVETKHSSIFDIDVVDLDKRIVPLSVYKNNVCLIVNVASQSKDSQKQLSDLDTLRREFQDKEFKLLLFPSNQFFNEPGNYEALKKIYLNQILNSAPVFGKVVIHFLNGKSQMKIK